GSSWIEHAGWDAELDLEVACGLVSKIPSEYVNLPTEADPRGAVDRWSSCAPSRLGRR
ncbi:unnamed protein product, partial [Urochloa humidicola]